MNDLTQMPWACNPKNGDGAIYASGTGRIIGFMATPGLAAAAVTGHNELLRITEAIKAQLFPQEGQER